MKTFIILYIIGYFISLILMINQKIKQDNYLKLGDLIAAIFLSSLSWLGLFLSGMVILFESNFLDIKIYKKKL